MPVLKATYPHHAKTEQNRQRYYSMVSNTTANSHTEVEFLKNLQTMSRPSMFQCILKIKYENYTLNTEELNVLKVKIEQMKIKLITEAMGPIELSIEQNSPSWNLERRVRITASTTKSFFTAKKLDNIVNDHLWKNRDISNIPAIQYGRDNEKYALSEYKNMTGFDVRKAGFFINNIYL